MKRTELMKHLFDDTTAWDGLPFYDELRTLANIIDRVEVGRWAYEGLPRRPELEATARVLDRIIEFQSAWEVLTNEELDTMIAKLERIAELRKEVIDLFPSKNA